MSRKKITYPKCYNFKYSDHHAVSCDKVTLNILFITTLRSLNGLMAIKLPIISDFYFEINFGCEASLYLQNGTEEYCREKHEDPFKC